MQGNNGQMPWLLTVLLPWITFNPYEYHVWYFVEWFWSNPEAADFVRSFTDKQVEKLIAAITAVIWGFTLFFLYRALFGVKGFKKMGLFGLAYVFLCIVAGVFEIVDFTSTEVQINALMLGIGFTFALARWQIAIASGVNVKTIRLQ